MEFEDEITLNPQIKDVKEILKNNNIEVDENGLNGIIDELICDEGYNIPYQWILVDYITYIATLNKKYPISLLYSIVDGYSDNLPDDVEVFIETYAGNNYMDYDEVREQCDRIPVA